MSELYMMVTITNRKYMSKFAALYRENQIEVGTVSLGMGTASSSILDYMGLEDDEKSICFHFVTEATWKKVKKGLQNQLRIDVPGTGIAFTIPMSSIGGKRELGFLIQGQEFVREEEGTLKETKHELIVAIANYGYNTQVMKAGWRNRRYRSSWKRGRNDARRTVSWRFPGFRKRGDLHCGKIRTEKCHYECYHGKSRSHLQSRNHRIFPPRNQHSRAADPGR